MIKSAFAILGIICLCGAMISVLFMVYYLIAMQTNVRPEKKRILPFLGPLQVFLPQMWNVRGNQARNRLIISILVFAVFFSTVAAIVEFSRR
jgi:hypothetical protein